MGTKLAKKWIKEAAKTVPSSQWQARGLKKAWALQKAAQGGKGKPKKGGGGGGGGGSSSGGSSKKPPRFGASYTAAKGAVVLLSPATETVLALGSQARIGDVAFKVRKTAYVGNIAVSLIDAFVDKKTGQPGAISRGSLTALLPEAYLGFLTWDELSQAGFAQESLRGLHNRLIRAHQGYDAPGNVMDLRNPEFLTYRALRHGGQFVRKARSKIKFFRKITEPIARLAKVLGGRI